MCGIIGLYTKKPELEAELGKRASAMLAQLSDRGPDSAGFAIYRNPADIGSVKVTLQAADLSDAGHSEDSAWRVLEKCLKKNFGESANVKPHINHAVAVVPGEADDVLSWLAEHHSDLRITSSGQSIEIYKEKGKPQEVIERFEFDTFSGTHALGHTRMATESAVTTEHSHPFSTGLDLCLVHNGSLSNHNRLRENLREEGIDFQTDNDSEVAAGYLTWRLREGDSLNEALLHALDDLDGFYTFAIGTRKGFAVLRDPIACKPAVMAETDDWVAMASEFRAIAQLPGVDHAEIWEPAPAQVYSWERDE